MSQTDRRQFLRAAVAGTGVAVETGSAGAEVRSSANEVEKTFTATAEEGFIAIDANNAQGDGSTIGRIDFAGGDLGGEVTISGEVYSDNTWQSTNVDFPPIDIKELIDPSLLDGLPVNISLDDIDADVSVTVDTITGTFDAAQPLMTADFSITVDASATISVSITSISIDLTVTASAPLTSGTSGSMQGNIENGLDPKSATARLVSNDFTVPATGEKISVPVVGDISIDDRIGLPADDPSRNYLSLTLDMDIAKVFGFVEGTVTGGDGIAESGIKVEILDDKGNLVSKATTDQNGQYSIGVKPGLYDIVVDPERFQRQQRPVGVKEDKTQTVDFSLTPFEYGTVTGGVIDAQSTPIEGVAVNITNTTNGTTRTVETGENGQYSAEIRVGDTYEISASKTGFGADSQLVKATSDGDTVTASLQLGEPPNPGLLYGSLQTRTTLNGVPVTITDPETGDTVQTVTTTNSSYTVSDLPPGEYGVVVDVDGYEFFADSVTVTEGEQKPFNIPLEETVPPIVNGRPPRDLDGDDTYENVLGDGTFDILDVQALFANLDNPTVQNHPWAFDFSGVKPDEVTITDVQALFNKLQGQN
jgi:hypothetical protein